MSYNGSGTFQINTSGQPVVAGTVISSTAFNALTADLATGLSTAITKDGQTTTTARIPFAQGISSTLTTDSSSVSTGSIITAGGVGIAKALYVGTNVNVAGTTNLAGLTASSAVATDASKNLVSVTNTGTGNNVLATSPTLVTPILGTPASGIMTNVTGINYDGFKNRIINGAMVIDQRNAGASVTLVGGGIYTVDRWQGYEDTDGAMTAQQDSSAPTGFINSLKFTTTTADASLASTQFALIQQKVEGFNISDLGWGTASASTVTLSFWVRSSLTGTFGGALRNSAQDRSYPFTYTISVADTWEQKTVTIAGDTSGTWLTTNGIGIQAAFGLGVGSTYSGTAGAWAAAQYFSATGATSVIGTLNATFYITGVQLEKGSTATSFDYRPYGTELALCQRYYWQSTSKPTGSQFYEAAGAIVSSNLARINFSLPTAMRTQPTIAINPVYNTGSSWQINLTAIANYALSQAPTILSNDGAAGGGGNMIAILFTTASTISSADYGRAAVPFSSTGTATNNFQFSAEL